METTDVSSPDSPADERPLVRAHTTSKERVVFTEPGNSDGWIATDLTVDLDR